MNELQKQFQEIKEHLQFEDYTLLTKRIIDLTLDTEDLFFYKKTNELLIWLDNNPTASEDKKTKFSLLLEELYADLAPKFKVQNQLLVRTEQLKKQYSSSQFALGPINLNIHQGEIIGLVGENGNGKTTLLRLLCGELYASSGSIQFNFDYSDLYDLRTKLVYIPQRTATWQGSMFENLQFTAASYGYKPEENEVVVELTIARLGLRKFRNHGWKDLSSGYKMRFELARMLLRKPKILLIDEPLANLDILAQQTVLEDFRAIAKSPFRPIGIILSSQQLYEVEKASDQVIFLKNGEQKNLHHKNVPEGTVVEDKHLIIEFESEWTQTQLNTLFGNHQLISLQFNGGTYIATFPTAVTQFDFLNIIISNQIPLHYFRNISNSSRRFFVS
ncbi:ATP-binding cassette domain-containing protein [Flavobacterium sp. '19STA2R22 D10 B1']|uniref:ABC transporter ATP-binding protein n=1 Tax=Flavobacterium aerium TaxID=3037261 RepID=UPI00278C1304|nr:ABC transporter ATP-binding protein [Flavobacterium sp. '19STA2R22 D10 B1']